MKIESGRYYKTRDGRKALVVGEMDRALGDGGDFAVQVGGDVHRYKSDGRWQYSTTSDILDLVAEWQEPVRLSAWLYLIRRPDGKIETTRENLLQPDSFFYGMVLARKQITITEGEGI